MALNGAHDLAGAMQAHGAGKARFFEVPWSVFLTHHLTVAERGDFYRLLGIDPTTFDAE